MSSITSPADQGPLDDAEQLGPDELGAELLRDLPDDCVGRPLTELDVTAQQAVEVGRVLARISATPDRVPSPGRIQQDRVRLHGDRRLHAASLLR